MTVWKPGSPPSLADAAAAAVRGIAAKTDEAHAMVSVLHAAITHAADGTTPDDPETAAVHAVLLKLLGRDGH